MFSQIQIKYARARLEELNKQKDKALRLKYTVAGRKLNLQECAEALRTGKFTVNDVSSTRGYWKIDDFIKYNDETESTFDSEAYEAEAAVIKIAFNKTMDELILGDEQEALAAIRAFEEM